MRTQNNDKLSFTKNDVLELNDSKLKEIQGGSTMICSEASTIMCLAAYITF